MYNSKFLRILKISCDITLKNDADCENRNVNSEFMFSTVQEVLLTTLQIKLDAKVIDEFDRGSKLRLKQKDRCGYSLVGYCQMKK